MKEDIKRYSNEDSNLPISMQITGISYCDGSYHIIRNNSHITVIEYIFSGEGYLIIKGNTIPVSEGNVYILPKGMDHEYYSSTKNPMQKIFMNIYGNLAVTLLSDFSLNGRYVFDGDCVSDLFFKAKDIMFSDGNYNNIDISLSSLYFEILSKLHLDLISKKSDSEAATLKRYLDANSTRIVGNAELSGQIYRSVDYCIKLFRHEYGTTPYDYQINYKLSIAKSLLRDTQLPVSEVAASVGYDDAQYFSNLFRSKCLISPREYRNKERNKK